MSETTLLPVLARNDSPIAVDPFKGFLDRSFDLIFEDMGLGWLPWVGRSYRESVRKTIILGESIYLYKTAAGSEATRARIESLDSLRKRHLDHAIEAKYKSRFVRNFERAVFQKVKPSRIDREKLWSEVIYHNLAPKMMAKLAYRPNHEHYRDGWRTLLKMAPAVGAARCIVYGHEKRKVDALLHVLSEGQYGQLVELKKLPVVGKKAVPVAVSLQFAGQQFELLFIGHPSRAFSWKQWGKLLQDRDMRPAH